MPLRLAVAHNAGIRALLELLRPANVVTALADVLAGYAVAGRANNRGLPWLLAATACLYAGGVALNDVFDRHVDRLERPERPIPSGRVSAGVAAALGLALLIVGAGLAAGAGLSAGLIALLLAFSILMYDGLMKTKWAGPLNMGLCRGLNLLLGVAAVPAALATGWRVALLPFTYITAVTMVSRGEVHGGGRTAAALALALLTAVVAAVAAIALLAAPRSIAGLVLSGVLAAMVLPPFIRVLASPEAARIRTAVRRGVLALVLLDAAVASVYAGVSFGAVVLATAILAAALARLFSVT